MHHGGGVARSSTKWPPPTCCKARSTRCKSAPMHDVFGELLPVFILIVVGWAVRATGIASPEALGHVNRFGYFVLYPAFLFTLSSQSSVGGAEALPFIGGLLA